MTKHKHPFHRSSSDQCAPTVPGAPDSGGANDDLESLKSEFDAYRADQESMMTKFASDVADLQVASTELKAAIAELKGATAPKPSEPPASGQDNGSGTVTPIDPTTGAPIGAPVDPTAPTEPAPAPVGDASDVTLEPGQSLKVQARSVLNAADPAK